MKFYFFSSTLSAIAILLSDYFFNLNDRIIATIFLLLPAIFFIVALIGTHFLGSSQIVFKCLLLIILWVIAYFSSVESWFMLTFIVVALIAFCVSKICKWNFKSEKSDRSFFMAGLYAGILGEGIFFLLMNLLSIQPDHLLSAAAPSVFIWQIAMGIVISKEQKIN